MSKFEIGTVYANIFQRLGSRMCGWKCIARKVSKRLNARLKDTGEIITVRFVAVDDDGNELGMAYSMRASIYGDVEEARLGGKFARMLEVRADHVFVAA